MKKSTKRGRPERMTVLNPGATNERELSHEVALGRDGRYHSIEDARREAHGAKPAAAPAPVVRHMMTAREFAMVPHRLVAGGNYAITAGGTHWLWDARFEHWARWK
jgi:hypothetical protein